MGRSKVAHRPAQNGPGNASEPVGLCLNASVGSGRWLPASGERRVIWERISGGASKISALWSCNE
jgi:hypothetical protein